MSRRNWLVAAEAIWPLLIKAAKQKRLLYYSDIAPTIRTNNRAVGRALDPVQEFCRLKLPPLTAIVVQKATDLPGPGFNAWPIDDIDSAFQSVFLFDWKTVPNPFKGFKGTGEDSLDSLSKKLLSNPERSADVYGKIRTRGLAQVLFREALLKAYDSCCTICGFSFEESLDACHIIPWQEATLSQRLDPRNGLLLCASHHRLFDAGWITVNESLRVAFFDPKMKCIPYSDADKSLTVSLHNRSINLPKDKKLLPNREYLKSRIFKKKSGS